MNCRLQYELNTRPRFRNIHAFRLECVSRQRGNMEAREYFAQLPFADCDSCETGLAIMTGEYSGLPCNVTLLYDGRPCERCGQNEPL